MTRDSITPAIIRLMSAEDRKALNLYEQIFDSSISHPGPAAVVERHPRPKPLETHQAEEAATGRLHVRFESVRKRLLDPDNIAIKWTLDCLRYCGAISGDEPDKITLEVTQRKCEEGEAEHTTIEITTNELLT